MNLIPLLQGALERVNRASKHFLDLKVEIEVIKQKQDDAVTWQFDPDQSYRRILVTEGVRRQRFELAI